MVAFIWKGNFTKKGREGSESWLENAFYVRSAF